MKQFICIHGHFYQPFRENPWLEAIEVQDSAKPYHDWNERITIECYSPNAMSRILDSDLRISKIVNNYARISFDVGPTLLSWLEAKAPDVYAGILEADRLSRVQYYGHGSAIAQVYNHMIMPLANRRQKVVQVHWAVRDFEARFGRMPEGMWLPETGVDVESLEVLADAGIRFTILAPHQARRIRRIGDRHWVDVNQGSLDTSVAYLAPLPSGRSIVLFFYNGDISRAVAFEGLLNNGEHLARRLTSSVQGRAGGRLAHIATDGETYGHHHRYGEMALAYALRSIESSHEAQLTNYAAFLERFPPAHEVEIHENTAWSCAHGVERWRSDCGCNVGHRSGWNQAWRTPLRAALNWLETEATCGYEQQAAEYLKDPLEALCDYIHVILNRSSELLDAFLERHSIRQTNPSDKTRVLKLLEMQRYSMLMSTSCGWFFDDISGIEAVQNLRYAARVIQLAGELFGADFEEPFLEHLEPAISNVPEAVNGRQIYESQVKPGITDLKKVAAHYALSSLFESYPDTTSLYCYTANLLESQRKRAGKARLVSGRVEVTSTITYDSAAFTYCALHLGEHNLTGGVRDFRSPEEYQAMTSEVETAFESGDLLRVVRLMDRQFAGGTIHLKQLFRDEQRKIVDLMLSPAMRELEESYDEIYEPHLPLMRFLEDMKIPLPKAFDLAAQFVLNTRLRKAFDKEQIDAAEIRALLDEAKTRRIVLDEPELGFQLRNVLKAHAEGFRTKAADLGVLQRLEELVHLVSLIPFPVVTWDLENAFFEISQTRYPAYKKRAEKGDQQASAWLAQFAALGNRLRVRV